MNEDYDYFELQRKYGGEYVVRCGQEVLVHSRSYADIVAWLNSHRPIPNGAIVTQVARPDVFALY